MNIICYTGREKLGSQKYVKTLYEQA